MAKPSWAITDPVSGSGNGAISNTAGAHTGRVQRSGMVTVTGNGVATPEIYEVIQSPKTEFAQFDNGAEMAADKQAGKLTVAGKSNSSKLTFSWVEDSGNGVEIPANFTANGAETANGTSITGDPGATAQFDFSIELDLPINDTIEPIERTLLVTANGGQAAQIVIKQTAGDARLSVYPKKITIPQDGSAVSVTVESNTTWTVS